MEFRDRVLLCQDCSEEFVFTAGEQLFFAQKNFVNDPKRCKTCKAKTSNRPLPFRQSTAVCSACGVATTVPFIPRQGRPVLCRTCFQKPVAAQPVTASDNAYPLRSA